MQEPLNLKPTHKLVKSYYETLGQFGQLNIDHEMAVRSAFQALLAGCGRQYDWTLVPEWKIQKPKAGIIKVDGALIDTFRLARGYWEAKDERDDLEKEITAKLEKGYPRNNIIFQAPEKAVLYQHGIRQGLNEDIRDSGNLVDLLKEFFAYREPHHEEWDAAVADFQGYIPQIAKAVQEKIEQQRRTNKAFVERFDAFYDLCRQAINPNLSQEAVEKMLVQHLMTERIFHRIFRYPDFSRRNVIAVEIEKVIDSMTAKEFSRDAFLKDLDRFYRAIESAAETAEDYSEKQHFINSVYERFFQSFSPKEADTHGIVYTPQPIVDFMVRSVEDILKKDFGRSLSDKGVHILDPFVGTGNFIIRVMKEIKTTALPYKYENELHCNEVMLLPYYVASMNIEHEYLERTGEYQPFPGICLVDTFELAEPEQSTLSFMSEENTERVQRQKKSPIFVIIANPPYNVGQLDENDNNKNRKYPTLDKRVSSTYAAASAASSVSKLNDPYVKAIRWATDRLGGEGVIAFVNNNSFIEQFAFDGMRKCLGSEFTSIYVLDLGANVRKNPELSGTTHNVFGIQVGVSINVFVRKKGPRDRALVRFAETPGDWRKEQKLDFLAQAGDGSSLSWKVLLPDKKENWKTEDLVAGFDKLLPIGSKDAKKGRQAEVVFGLYTLGLNTARDAWAYNFDHDALSANIQRSIAFYNSEVFRYLRDSAPSVDGFVRYHDRELAWSRDLKADLKRGRVASFEEEKLRRSLYRPFTTQWAFVDRVMNEEIYQLPKLLPTCSNDLDNRLICVGAYERKPFSVLCTATIPNLNLFGDPQQVFPYCIYDEDGSNRRENITDWALNEFRTHYSDPNITKWDIFHYVYAVLHHPEYRQRYAANLKRELPRIPFVGRAGLQASVSAASFSNGAGLQPGETGGSPGLQAGEKQGAPRAPSTLPKASAEPTAERPKEIFRAFADAGKKLADLHVSYEQQPQYPLERVEKGQLNWRVEKMRLSKDKATLVYNEFLTLKGIPPETYEYRLGNRSALEWVIDQYQVSTDKRSGITNDPNRGDDPEYVVRLIGQVITVSLETMEILKTLPALRIDLPPTDN